MAGRRRRRPAPLLLAALGLWAGLAADATGQGSPTTDRAALEALYDATGGPTWTDSTNWKTEAPLGEWYGVTTDADGRVTGLDLGWNELSGPIPRELGHLSNIEELRLAGNRLTGRVPASLGDLTGLRSLNLDWNELSGPLPRELARLKNLELLSLRGISLRGPAPPWLGDLPHLRDLALARSELTGPVPPWLGGIASLRLLDLRGNELSGPVPRELERLVNLKHLQLAENQLTGPIPAWLGGLTGLGLLDLGGNEWSSGPLPRELGRLVNLESLTLWGVGASGPLPAWLGDLTNLQRLDLGGNELSGSIPSRELGNLTNLRTLDLDRNDLTGTIPAELGSLANLETLDLSHNDLTGPIPAELGSLANLETLDLSHNDLTGPIPAELGSLANLETLDLSYNWGLSGPLPVGLEQSALEELDIFVTRTCAPAAWGEWLAAVEFWGLACDAGPDATIDIAVLYTPAAREAAGGAAGIEAEIDLWIAETNEAYAASRVRQRLALVGRSEVPYTETNGFRDVRRLADPSDGHLDEAHTLREQVGADLVHLIVRSSNVCGIAADIPSVFGLTKMECGGLVFAHELGHNMGLRHDRFQVDVFEGSLSSHPAYGYVNQAVFDATASPSDRWTTIMSYPVHCRLADVACSRLPRFSNPRQRHDGEVLGVPFGAGSGLTGASDAAAVLEAMGPAVAAWRDRPADAANRPPVAVGALPDRRLESAGAVLQVNVSQAFSDPEGEALTYKASSSAPWRVRAQATGAVVTLTGTGEGAATIRVTATDPGGLSGSRAFAATVDGPADTDPQDSAESDRSALEALYDAGGGAGWTDSTNWMTSAPLDEWYGVTTDADGRVTGVDLVDNGLAGWLPPALGSLARLKALRLARDELTGPIPSALGNLANLELLHLWETELTGTIPGALGRLVNLRVLDVHSDHLTGTIPSALGNLVNLERMYLGNKLTGPVPSWLGNLSQLRELYLGGDLTGRLPDALGNLVNLERLDLAWNELTGPVPSRLGNLSQLRHLYLGGNDLTGRLPNTLGSLANLQYLDLFGNDLTGTIPAALGGLANLKRLNLANNWGLSGPLPVGLEQSALEKLDIFVTRTCAPAAWEEWLATIEFWGPPCGAPPDVTIDIAVVYTPAAREAAGGAAGIEAEIDLWIAETNQAYAASGVDLRLVLVDRSEVAYTETGPQDVHRLRDPSDGHLDEVHALRDRVGADLVHLIVAESPGVCGIAAGIGSVFGLTVLKCGGIVFAHEVGHNLGLRHDRFQVQLREGSAASHPAYGYVNQEMFGAAAPPSSRWVTIMSYPTQCGLADARCAWLPRFSNPRQHYDGDALGVAVGSGSGVTGAADAAAVLNATGPAAAAWRDRPARVNRAPVAVGTLPDRRLSLDATLDVDLSRAFDDPDGDPLTYAASTSAADVATVRVAGARVTLTAVGEGTAAIRVTATDPGGLSAEQQFRATVAAVPQPFTDDPLLPGVTPIRAVHFAELRTRVDILRAVAGLARFRWTDPVLTPGLTRVRLAHLLELREALAEAYAVSGRPAPRWTDAAPVGGAIPIRATHLTELRAAVLALE